MHTRHVKLLATGTYLPKRIVTAQEMDLLLGVKPGWVLKKTEVAVRHFVDGETGSYMGAQAALQAMERAELSPADIDCLVCASGTIEQPIPCNAALLQRELGAAWEGIPCFDVQSTCLSFVAALDALSCMIDCGRYRRVLIVSSEIASKGLNWANKESAALFGDGAAAAVVEASEAGDRSCIVHAAFRTYGAGAHLSEIKGGGSALPAYHYTEQRAEDYLFAMDGQAIFRMAAKLLPDFVDQLLKEAKLKMDAIKLVIPHQGSAMAMRLIQRRLGIAADQMMSITANHGNTIASSIPLGLHEAIRQQRIVRGDRVLLLGTSAGLSLGGMILAY